MARIMKRIWKKPELIIEDYELLQVIASGCGTKYPGTTVVTVECGCDPSYPGQGHWHREIEVKDTDGNGRIDYYEFVAQKEAADNRNQTGKGHMGHGMVTYIDGVIVEAPFTS